MNDQEKAAMQIVMAVGSAIKELHSVPSGYLYANLMGRMSLDTYNKVIDILVRSGSVQQSNHVLTWVGK
jgi:hypothetical protein